MSFPETVQIETDESIPLGDVEKALRIVNDPELLLDIVTLELIRLVQIKEGTLRVVMTLTTPFCPYGPQLIEQARIMLEALPSVKDVTVDLDLDEPWQPSERVKQLLGLPL